MNKGGGLLCSIMKCETKLINMTEAQDKEKNLNV